MEKYYVIINGIKHYAKNKRKADALLIDAFLGGVHNIDWNIYENK